MFWNSISISLSRRIKVLKMSINYRSYLVRILPVYDVTVAVGFECLNCLLIDWMVA